MTERKRKQQEVDNSVLGHEFCEYQNRKSGRVRITGAYGGASKAEEQNHVTALA